MRTYVLTISIKDDDISTLVRWNIVHPDGCGSAGQYEFSGPSTEQIPNRALELFKSAFLSTERRKNRT